MKLKTSRRLAFLLAEWTTLWHLSVVKYYVVSLLSGKEQGTGSQNKYVDAQVILLW